MNLRVQDRYKAMLRDTIAPALRRQGFKGSAAQYTLPSDSHWGMLGFQGSTSNSAATVKFTVNCKVVSKAVWDAVYQERPHIGAKPKANIGAGSFEWWYRIGQLMPGGNDKWWTIDETTDLVPLAAEVVQALEVHALPAMRAEIRRS